MFCYLPLTGWAAKSAEKIGLLDVQEAVLNSTPGKNIVKQLHSEFAKQADSLRSQGKAIEQLEAKRKKDALTLSKNQLSKLDREIEQKKQRYFSQAGALREKEADRQQELIQKIDPEIKKAIDEAIKEAGYSLVFDRRAAIYGVPQVDLTSAVTKKLNALVKKSGKK
jgi:outer membrane protein